MHWNGKAVLPGRKRGNAIRQIAALPYRTEGTGIDAPVSILLVTSRGTGRWVVPKGNSIAGLAPHVAAAQEAEEEAGVLGAVCPTPIGTYRYRKVRDNGASLWVDVNVFPFAVAKELDTWKEAHQRERRWFSLSEAAQMVDEDDLKDLIRSFRASEFKAAAGRTGMFDRIAKNTGVSGMFAWFQRLLPK